MSEHTEYPAADARGHLREYLAVLWIRKWSILLVTILVVGGALAYSFRQVPVYRSTARILAQPGGGSTTPGAAPAAPSTINLQTEGQLLASTEVAEKVAEKVDAPLEPRKLLSGLSVQIQPESQIIGVNYVSQDPIQAQRLAQTFAETYLEHRLDQVVDEVDTQRQTINKQVNQLENKRTKVETRLNELPLESSERPLVQSEWNSLTGRIAVLQQQLYALAPQDSLRVGEIIEDATLPSAPVSPNHVRTGAIAAVIGLVLGMSVAFLRERLDDSLRGRSDLERHIGAPVLAIVPHASSWRRRQETPLVTAAEPRSNVAEAYRTLRTSLLFAMEQRGAKAVMITSAQEGEGKTATTANLGLSLAQAGKRVILLAADLRKPRLHRFFGVGNEAGLTSMLNGEAKPWECVIDVGYQNLRLVPGGPVPGNPAEILGSDAMGRLIDQFREVADVVLIDCPPVLVVADTLALAPLTDAVLFVADAEKTNRGAVGHARQQLDQMDAPIVGAMLNNFDPSTGRRTADYYYGYYYRYYEDGERSPRRRRGTRRHRGGVTPGFEPSAPVVPEERDMHADAVWSKKGTEPSSPPRPEPAPLSASPRQEPPLSAPARQEPPVTAPQPAPSEPAPASPPDRDGWSFTSTRDPEPSYPQAAAQPDDVAPNTSSFPPPHDRSEYGGHPAKYPEEDEPLSDEMDGKPPAFRTE